MAEHEEPSSGVRSLIDRVRSEGVEAASAEAEKILEEARNKAARIVEDARKEAERYSEKAREQERVEREAGRAALRQAARDAVLALEEQLTQSFGRQLQRVVTRRMEDSELLEKLILELVGAEQPESDERPEVLLPPRALELQELEKENRELGRDPVDAFVLGLAQTELREGVTLQAGPEGQVGIRIRLDDGNVEVDATAEAVAELLERHLLPRFRGLLEGVYR